LQNVSALSSARGIGSLALDGAERGVAPGEAGSAASAGLQPSFAEALDNMASDMVTDLRTAEKVSFEGIRGEATTREVVDAVMTAQRTLQTALAIRDKIVSAYLEISRMSI
jgi:flagellar hook-basal body complex protein FliE